MHLHSNGRHLLDAALTLKRLKAIYLLDEKDNPPAFEELPDGKGQKVQELENLAILYERSTSIPVY